MKTLTVRIKKLPETNVALTQDIKDLAEALIASKGVAAIQPIIYRDDYSFENEEYIVRTGEAVIAAAKYATTISKLKTIEVKAPCNKADERNTETMLAIQTPAAVKLAPTKEMTREEKVAMIAKLAAELA